MTICEKFTKNSLFLLACLAGAACLFTGSGGVTADQTPTHPEDSKKVIVVDPGHGGHDWGARGIDGSLEKEVVLRLAFEIANQLKPHYRVVITRTGDYQVDLARRTALANHEKGELFISIHTAGSPQYHINTWEIYTYNKKTPSTEEAGLPTNSDDSAQYCLPWEDIQIRYIEASRRLAECLRSRLMDNDQIPAVEVHEAPLRVLEGADMPAVLLEAGYLTHPAAGQMLNDPDFLSKTAADIAEGIDAFFNVKTEPPA